MDKKPKNPDHNLVNQVRVNSRFSSRVLFVYTIKTLTVVGALLFGFGYRWFLEDGIPLFPLFLLLAFYLITSGTLTLITKDSGKRHRILFIEIVVLVVPFLDWPLGTVTIMAVLLLIFFSWGISQARRELYSNTEIHFFRIIRPHFGKMLTGLAFMVLLLYMPKWSAKDVLISEGGFERFFGSTSEVVSNFYPEIEFSSTSTIGNMAENIALSRLQKNSIFKNLPAEAREQAVRAAANEFITALRENFGTEIREEDTATRVFYDAVIGRMTDWKDRFGITFSVVWAAIMFFLIRGLGVLVSWISMGILFLIYHLLLSINVMRIGTENKTVETLELV